MAKARNLIAAGRETFERRQGELRHLLADQGRGQKRRIAAPKRAPEEAGEHGEERKRQNGAEAPERCGAAFLAHGLRPRVGLPARAAPADRRDSLRLEVVKQPALLAVVGDNEKREGSHRDEGEAVSGKDENCVGAEIGHGVRTSRFGQRRMLDLHLLHRPHAPAQDFRAHRHQMQKQEQQGEGERHDGERRRASMIDGRAAHADDARRLVQRVPPVDRELDDREG